MKYLALMFALGGLTTKPHFEITYKCNGTKGQIIHPIDPTPRQCQLKMYAINHDLNQSCKQLTIERSYCGY